MEGKTIRWRGEHEKTGYEHQAPMTAEAFPALEEARRQNPGIGDIPLPPAPKDPSVCLSRSLARDWWNRAPRLALAEAEVRLGPHGSAAQGAVRTWRLENGLG